MRNELRLFANQAEPRINAFLRDLIKIPSVNGRDTEKKIANRILEEASILGLDAALAFKDDARPNVMVTFGKGQKGFALIAHTDTVAEGKPADWTHPPFSAEIENGLMFGRGAADNKAGIACSLYTLAAVRDLGLLDPNLCKIIFAGVVDEESGASSTLGVRHLLDQGLLSVSGAIYTYTSDIVCIGHRGLIRLELTVLGESAHAGLAGWYTREFGANAVTGLAEILVNLEKLSIQAEKVPGFEHLGFSITPGTMISGGDYPSIVPNKAQAIVDIRLMPGQSAEEVLHAVQEIVDRITKNRKGIRAEIKKTVDFPGASIAIDHPLAVLAKSTAESVTGNHWARKGAGPGNEGYMLIGAGIPTLCGFGATGGNPHAPDEWVALDSLIDTTIIYSEIITAYLNAR